MAFGAHEPALLKLAKDPETHREHDRLGAMLGLVVVVCVCVCLFVFNFIVPMEIERCRGVECKISTTSIKIL